MDQGGQGEQAAAVVEAPAPEMAAAAVVEAPAPGVAEAAAMVFEIPPGIFDFPWLQYRGGLGVPSGGNGAAVAELRDVYFRSLVDGSTPAVGVQWDRLIAPPRDGELFEHLEAWLATAAADRELQDPVWRAVLLVDRPNPAAA